MANGNAEPQGEALALRFPVCSTVKLSLKNDVQLTGEIFTTDEESQVLVLVEKSGDFRMISVNAVQSSEVVTPASSEKLDELKKTETIFSKKALDEKEKRAVRLAKESFKHYNPKASPLGQAVFDRLIKACNEVVWKGETILVLNQIQVDPPYAPENCRIVRPGSGSSSLERVKKIVASMGVPSES